MAEISKDNSIILNELIPRCTPKAAELLKRGLLGAIKVCAVNECVHVQKNKQRGNCNGRNQ